MSKIQQKIFSKYYIEELISQVELINIGAYILDVDFPYDNKIPPGKSLIEVNPNIELKYPNSGSENFDIDNALIIYNEFKGINETQASDPRLWTYLTHVTFWNYMRKRWPAEKFEDETDELFDDSSIKNKQANFILSRYFLITSNRRRLLRNGISRLWWYAHLTFDSKREDPFELTRILLSHQDKAQNLLERSLGSNRQVLISVLEFLKQNPSLTRDDVRELIKEINLVGGVKNLHLLDNEEIIAIIK